MARIIFYKTLALSLFVSGITLGVTGQVYAFSNTSKHIGLRFGITEYNFDNEGFESSSELAGLTGGMRKGPLEIELSLDYTEILQNLTFFQGFCVFPILCVGDIHILRIKQEMLRAMVSGKYHFLGEESVFDPYIGLGGGYYFPLENNTEILGIGKTERFEYKDVLGLQFSSGFDFRFNPRLSLGMDFRYFLLRSDFVVESGDTRTVDWTPIKVLEYGISLKYHFPN